jgi:hypothetical protein
LVVQSGTANGGPIGKSLKEKNIKRRENVLGLRRVRYAGRESKGCGHKPCKRKTKI